jgi:hypothetical protein
MGEKEGEFKSGRKIGEEGGRDGVGGTVGRGWEVKARFVKGRRPGKSSHQYPKDSS